MLLQDLLDNWPISLIGNLDKLSSILASLVCVVFLDLWLLLRVQLSGLFGQNAILLLQSLHCLLKLLRPFLLLRPDDCDLLLVEPAVLAVGAAAMLDPVPEGLYGGVELAVLELQLFDLLRCVGRVLLARWKGSCMLLGVTLRAAI